MTFDGTQHDIARPEMDIPVGAGVECADGLCGKSTYVVIDPAAEQVTHVVVKERIAPHIERLVPREEIMETTPRLIRLRCASERLSAMPPFVETDYVKSTQDFLSYAASDYVLWPDYMPVMVPPVRERRHLPPGELAVAHGARVEARDGHVGWVDEFLVDPASGQITHLILRTGHLWGQRDVSIPADRIDRIGEDAIFLKLTKNQVGQLPRRRVSR